MPRDPPNRHDLPKTAQEAPEMASGASQDLPPEFPSNVAGASQGFPVDSSHSSLGSSWGLSHWSVQVVPGAPPSVNAKAFQEP
eukprot:5365987-Pyramimonas_sp.AAC.1